MPETLYVEGPGRDEIIARIRNDFGYAATITDVKRIRRGGVLGFFAREYTSVAFQITEGVPGDVPAAVDDRPEPSTDIALTLEELLARADGADGATARPQLTDHGFAELLAQLVATPPHDADPAPLETPVVEARDWPPPVESPRSDEARRPAESPARVRLEMLSELRSVGVPLTNGPDEGETNLYRAIEQIVQSLPAAPPPPSRAGDVLVLAGTAGQLDAAAATLARLARVPDAAIWRVDPWSSHERSLSGPAEAAQCALELRTGLTASIVVVELDRDRSPATPFDWSAQVIAALAPTALWVAVDASRKTEDVRSELAHLGPIDALIVNGVAATSSPGTVWDLDLPIAVVDGRPASRGTWSGLLFDALEAGARR
jgi:hypothetical protein